MTYLFQYGLVLHEKAHAWSLLRKIRNARYFRFPQKDPALYIHVKSGTIKQNQTLASRDRIFRKHETARLFRNRIPINRSSNFPDSERIVSN